MTPNRYTSFLLALLCCALPFAVHAQEIDLTVEVTDGVTTQTLHVGLDPAATDGIDGGAPLNEVEQPPAPPTGNFDARLIDDDIPITGLGEGVLRDFRNCTTPCSSFTGTVNHELQFQLGTGTGITVSWNLPPNVTGVLNDIASGGLGVANVPMNGTGSLVVPALVITAGGKLLMDITYAESTPPPDINVAPTPYDYGDVRVGMSASQTFIVTNAGGSDLEVSGSSLAGADAGEFSIDAGGGAVTIPAGGTHNIDVSFNPTSAGAKTATLSVASNDPDTPSFDVSLSGNGTEPDIAVDPMSHDYGSVTVSSSASHTFEVRNEGNADLMVSGSSLVGADAGEFSIDAGGGAVTIPAGGTHDIDVSFNPTSVGAKSATLSIASDDPDENPLDVALSGTGEPEPVPDIAVDPTSHDYGAVTVSTSRSQTFEVTNEGTADLMVSGSSLTGPDAGQYSINSGSGAVTIVPGGTHMIEVSCTPTSEGTKTAALSIASNDPDENPFDVALSCTGVEELDPPEIDVTPDPYDYGTVQVGMSASQTFVVENQGDEDLEVSGSSLIGADAAEYSIDSGGGAVTVPGGGTHNIEVSFNPTSAGAKTATLRVASNDADEPDFDVELSGTGEEVPPEDDTPPVCEIDRIDMNDPVTLYVHVSDAESGLQMVDVLKAKNAIVTVPAFTPGTNAVVEVQGVKINQSQKASVVLEVTDVAGNSVKCDPVLTTLESEQPAAFALDQNYPNPFNPTTTIRLAVAEAGPVLVRIYDIMGREVITLVDKPMEPGTYEVQWTGVNARGELVPSGVYVYRMDAGTFSATRSLTLLK